jgi:hypothetical protein
MYHPVQSNRLFTFNTKYDAIDWNNFAQVVDAFQRQLEYWYILPGLELKKHGYFGFPIAALACLLVDCLSQFEAGIQEGTSNDFKTFLRTHWPRLGHRFPVPIKASHAGRWFDVRDGADAIYHGVRCGILHEAHVKLYTGLMGQGEIAKYHSSGLATYSNGANCPVVSVDPDRLFDAIHDRFTAYTSELKKRDQRYNDLRQRFKTKFESSYGVTISISV